MKMIDIRKQTTAELASESSKLRDEIAELRRRVHMGELNNVRAIRAKRKDLARVLTILGEKLLKESA